MAYISGGRNQMTYLPPTIEEYISTDDPVRVYDKFIEAIDIKELGIRYEANKAGAHEYDPKAMLKLLVYGYAYGIRSSRKLEQATKHNLSFIWLTANLNPDYRTIARFRKDNIEALKKILKKCAQMCMKLGLIGGNTLFTDGTKIRANASIKNSWNEEKCKEYLKKIEENIANILKEADEIDEQEQGKASLVKLEKELSDATQMKSKIQEALKEIEESEKTHLNTTDRDSVMTRKEKGINHNIQITVDGEHGLITNTESIAKPNDNNQLRGQVEKAKEVLEKTPETVCADAGYWGEDIVNIKDTTVVVPDQKLAQRNKKGTPAEDFNKSNFKYDADRDEYICPKGNKLRYRKNSFLKDDGREYRAKPAECTRCEYFGNCTKSKSGRTVVRLKNEEDKQRLRKIYKSEKGQQIYKKRKGTVERVIGHIKENMGVRSFLIRGKPGVDAEMSIIAVAANVTRMITILGGVAKTVEKISNFQV